MPMTLHILPDFKLLNDPVVYKSGLALYSFVSLLASTRPIIPNTTPIPQIGIDRMPKTNTAVALGSCCWLL